MERHATFLVPCLAVVMLLAVIFITGCDEERSLLSPEQEGIQAPGKGNPHINGNDNAKPNPKGNAVGNPHINDNDKNPKGNAVGNPHINGNDNAKPDPNGKAVGNPHVNGNSDAEPNADSNDNDKSKGAVKLPLRVEGEPGGEAVGWVIINTSTDAADEVEPDDEDVDFIALGVSTNGFLIVNVHLRIRGGDVEKGSEFSVDVLVSEDSEDSADETFLFPAPLTVNAKGIGNAKATFDLGDLGEGTSKIYVKVVVSDGMVYDTGLVFVAVQLKN